MSVIAALVLAATTAQATPASPLFETFKAACYDVEKFDGVGPAAIKAGWTEVSEAEADPRIASIVKRGKEAAAKEEPEAISAGSLFRHKADGRDVYLFTSRIQAKKGWWAAGCRAYDLDAPAPPTTAQVIDWVGKPPTASQANGTATKLLWEPWQTGVSLEITYVPRDHELGKTYGIHGLVLVSQAIGGF